MSKRIREIVEKRKTAKASEGSFPYIEIGDIDTNTKDYSLKDKGSVPGAVLAYQGEILVSTVRPTRGAITTVKEKSPAVSSAFAVLKPDERLCMPRYLFYCLCSKPFLQYLGANSKGATYPTCSKDDVLDYEFKVAELSAQAEIINRLDTVSSIIIKRQQELSTLDELIKARFIEMFGDPVRNEMEWQTKALEDACKSIVDCPHSTPSYTLEDTGFMCIRTSIVKKNRIMWEDIEYIPEEEYIQRIQRKKPEKGDVIYTREGAILGIAAVLDRDCNVALGQRSMLLSPDRAFCTPEFISVAMNFDSFLDNALKEMSGSASPHINVGDIKAFKMILPPIAQQEAFSTFVAQIDKSKVVVQKALDEAQLLFDSLMQQYFG
ncbi:MAG: restriction endonuclease subunit S [Erysipelotrichaceae bacterium]|nr:restriction endonuclease subunit S [Erysipelotrichaceae bacterium]